MLDHLDGQLLVFEDCEDAPTIYASVRDRLASTIYAEVRSLDDASVNRLRGAMPIPPERYVEEMLAFQKWTEVARQNRRDPFVVRARVMTELYVAFVWLRDSVRVPVREAVGEGTTTWTVCHFLESGPRRLLRNAIAHGRWTYLADFSGIEYWAEPSRGKPLQRYEIKQDEFGPLQTVSRGASIAMLLALTDQI